MTDENSPDNTQPLLARRRSDVPFFLVMSGLSSCFILLIVLLLAADILFTSPSEFIKTVSKPEIQFAFRLTLFSCTAAAILSIWVATPLGYLLSRYKFPGRWIIDTIVDIPIVLPPLVLGLSLLILFHFKFGQWQLEQWLREDVGFPVAFRWPAVVLAQFSVACAFAVRTMRVTFDQIDPRRRCRANAWMYARTSLHESCATTSMAGNDRSNHDRVGAALGEFGPILVFAGSTRMRTEVLSTSVFLELSIGELGGAVSVSLLMVAMAVVVLVLLRVLGAGLTS